MIRWLFTLTFALLMTIAVTGIGDELILKSGGRLQGKVISASSSSGYLLELPSGGRVRIPKPAVARLAVAREVNRSYQDREQQTPDTAAAQWELAEWCRKQRLGRERRRHLKRAIELDSDHHQARHAMGYSFVRGRWQKPEEFRREEGYVKYQGRWRLPQEVAVMEQREKQKRAENAWKGKIKRLRASLLTETNRNSPRHQELTRSLSSIRDPAAVTALNEFLDNEPYRAVKFLYLDSLAIIRTPRAIESLVERSMDDPDEEVFHECLAHLTKLKTPAIVQAYIKYLKHRHNARVNRAALALQKLADQEAISPLIDSLITSHLIYLKPPGGSSPDAITTSFVNPGSSPAGAMSKAPFSGTGMTAGNRTKVIPLILQNSEVLSALVKLSGGLNFGYSQAAWRNWNSARIRGAASSASLRF